MTDAAGTNDSKQEEELAWFGPLRRCLQSLMDLEALMAVHESGMEALVFVGDTIRGMGDFPDDFAKAFARDAAHAAQGTGSNLMYGHSAIGLWAQLEVLVEDLACAWIVCHQETLELSELTKVKVPLAEYMRLGDDDRIRVLVLELQRQLRADLAEGATRFDRLINAIGIGGETPDRVRKAIFELWHVRNVWAHRAGVADQRFVNACPWLGHTVGQRVDLDFFSFGYYLHAAHVYVGMLSGHCRSLSDLPAHRHPRCLDKHVKHMEAHQLWDSTTNSRRVGPAVDRARWGLFSNQSTSGARTLDTD